MHQRSGCISALSDPYLEHRDRPLASAWGAEARHSLGQSSVMPASPTTALSVRSASVDETLPSSFVSHSHAAQLALPTAPFRMSSASLASGSCGGSRRVFGAPHAHALARKTSTLPSALSPDGLQSLSNITREPSALRPPAMLEQSLPLVTARSPPTLLPPRVTW